MANPETMHDRLVRRLHEVVRHVVSERLPGADEYVAGDARSRSFIEKHALTVDAALVDENEPLFDKSLGSWIKGWERVNEIIAEDLRSKKPITECELRYVRWMALSYIHFDCSITGDFYLLPRKPYRAPGFERWCTVDEMIDILGTPVLIDVIRTCHAFPVRPERLKTPGMGEEILRVDLTGAEMRVRARRGKRP
jgi:hypothetical protein